MPLYEYKCDACGHRFEVIQKRSDQTVETCPSCGGAVHKLQSAPAFHFKGTGWYVTDYAKKDQPGTGASPESKDASKDTEKKDTEKKEKGEKSDKSEKTAEPAKSSSTDTTSSSSSAGPTASKS